MVLQVRFPPGPLRKHIYGAGPCDPRLRFRRDSLCPTTSSSVFFEPITDPTAGVESILSAKL